MGFELTNTVSSTLVFFEGLLSFLSPCVIPLVPVYLSYLSGGIELENQKARRKKLMFSMLFFVLGISFAFFALGFSVSVIGQFFANNRRIFATIGGILLIAVGLLQLGIFGKKELVRQIRLPFQIKNTMNPFTAFALGFTFSFAWTPCVGPALASVLVIAGTSNSASLGYLYIALYTLGFIIPFLILGFFADKLLSILQKNKGFLTWTKRLASVILIIMGALLVSGWVTSDTFQSTFPGASDTKPQQTQQNNEAASSVAESKESAASSSSQENTQKKKERPIVPAVDFELKDQNGNTHKLSDYKGKVVFLNFWADWCEYCVKEMPDIQKLYEETGENKEDVIVLGITYGLTQEKMAEHFTTNGFTYPTLLDTTQNIFRTYGAFSLPMTYMIDRDGNVFGYLRGMMTKEIMDEIVQQTLDASPKKES